MAFGLAGVRPEVVFQNFSCDPGEAQMILVKSFFCASDNFFEISRAIYNVGIGNNYIIGIGREMNSLICSASVAEIFFVGDDDEVHCLRLWLRCGVRRCSHVRRCGADVRGISFFHEVQASLVRRIIINKVDVDVFVGLRENVIQAGLQILRGVVVNDDDCDFGLHVVCGEWRMCAEIIHLRPGLKLGLA